MKRLTLPALLGLILFTCNLSGQKIYPISSGEIIFSNGTIEFTDEFMQENPYAQAAKVPVRFTVFFHYTQFWHFDLTENFGFFTGLGIRNIGIISDERLSFNNPTNENAYEDYKIIRRLYTGGIPLSIKIGSFKDNLYLFAGGEYEFAIHYKEKYWNANTRSGSKSKYKEWFGSQTPAFLPSVFVGAQFPGGFNLKFKYYMNNFLNNNYKNKNQISNLERYKTSQVWYISLSWQFNTAYLTKKSWDEDEVALR